MTLTAVRADYSAAAIRYQKISGKWNCDFYYFQIFCSDASTLENVKKSELTALLP
jgi:hypothetical protein